LPTADAAEQEVLETFILERIRSGAQLPGTYPPNAETLAAFEAWRKGISGFASEAQRSTS